MFDKRVKQAKEMLKELEDEVGPESILGLVPLFFSLAIASAGISITAASLKDSNLI